MKYFVYISLNCGTDFNALYESLPRVRKSLEQLVVEQGLDLGNEEIPGVEDLKKHFKLRDVYYGGLSNDDWFHIQKVADKEILSLFSKNPRQGRIFSGE